MDKIQWIDPRLLVLPRYILETVRLPRQVFSHPRQNKIYKFELQNNFKFDYSTFFAAKDGLPASSEQGVKAPNI